MNRREFVKTLGILGVIPSLSLNAKAEEILIHQDLTTENFAPEEYPLKIVEDSFRDEWGLQYVTFSKGLYSTTVCANAIEDLRDCHGLCACAELSNVIMQELEFSPDVIKKILYYDYNRLNDEEYNERRKKWINSLKRIHLSLEDKIRICAYFENRRGTPKCLLNHYVITKPDIYV